MRNWPENKKAIFLIVVFLLILIAVIVKSKSSTNQPPKLIPANAKLRSKGRQTGESWMKVKNKWRHFKGGSYGTAKRKDKNPNRLYVSGRLINITPTTITVAFDQSGCQTSLIDSNNDGFSDQGKVCGQGSFSFNGKVRLNRATVTADSPDVFYIKENILADYTSLRPGDYVELAAPAEVFQNLTGQVDVFGQQ